jgi:hypothetical protein
MKLLGSIPHITLHVPCHQYSSSIVKGCWPANLTTDKPCLINRTMSRTQTESHDVPEYCSELLNILVDDPINMWMITCQTTRDCTQLGPPALLEQEQRQPSLGLPSAARPPPRATPDSPHASPSIASRLASDIHETFCRRRIRASTTLPPPLPTISANPAP